MLVSKLARLMDSGDYKRCLEEAALLLAEGGHDAEATARIHAAICRSRLELADYFGAVEAGQKAIALADSAELADLRGFLLPDHAMALCEVRRYDDALAAFDRFLSELPAYTGARCREGSTLQRLAATLYRSGSPEEALKRYWQAHAWFQRYGDSASGVACTRAILRIHLDQGQPEATIPLLLEGDRYAQAHPLDREFLTAHLLDRAQFHLSVGRYDESMREAFQALEAAEDRLVHQSRAHLILAQNALAMDRPQDALSFALAGRVAAIDGKVYDLEFEASEILFRLMQQKGARLVQRLEADYYEQRVDIYRYLSERVVRRMTDSQ